MKSIILLVFFGIAAGVMPKYDDQYDVKKNFERFELHQKSLKDTFINAYNNQRLMTFVNIIQKNTIPDEEIQRKKDSFDKFDSDATVGNNKKLAAIADWFAEENFNYLSIIDGERLSRNLKFQALMKAVKQPDGVKPTPNELKKAVDDVIKAEHPISGSTEPAYDALYAMLDLSFVPYHLQIQAKMEVIKPFYKLPEVGLSKDTIAKIDKILEDNEKAEAVVEENFRLDNADRVAKMLKVLPVYLKTESDLYEALTSAKIECNYVRCRNTKDDRNVITQEDVMIAYSKCVLFSEYRYTSLYENYQKLGLQTMARILEKHTIPADKISEVLQERTLRHIPESATTDHDVDLARIANQIYARKIIFQTFDNNVTISDNLKLQALILAVENPAKTSYPTATDLKNGVKTAIKAENPKINLNIDDAYANLYAMNGEHYVVPHAQIQAKMDIIREYYWRPEVELSIDIKARIDRILRDNKFVSMKLESYFPINDTDRMNHVLATLPAYLKTNTDLIQALKDGKYECSYVRCRSTKNDPTEATITEAPMKKPANKPADKPIAKPTDKPIVKLTVKQIDNYNSTNNYNSTEPVIKPTVGLSKSSVVRTSGSIFATVSIILCHFFI